MSPPARPAGPVVARSRVRTLLALVPLAPLTAFVALGGVGRGQGVSAVAAGAPGAGVPAAIQNVVVLIADDLGVDQLACYGEGSDLPVTPVIDGLAASGVLFRNAWSQPVCSPTRAGIFTGRHGFRTGIGDIVTTTSEALPLSEVIVPELLDQELSGYRHALIGKWHLGNETVGGVLSPEVAGWTKFDGSLFSFEPAPQSYTLWPRIVAGVQHVATRYATTAHVDAALKWIGNQQAPWMLFLAFDAPHAPYHVPPAGLYYENLNGVPQTSLRPHYKAMVEAMDTEIGRLLDGIAALGFHGTQAPLVIFVGDNGTPNEVAAPPIVAGKAKGTLYEGGLNVPLIVSGRPGTPPGSECAALAHATDLFATLAEVVGIDLDTALAGRVLDSVSLLPLIEDPAGPPVHQYVYAELFDPVGVLPPQNHRSALRDARYKLIRRPGGDEFFDLLADPLEEANLLAVGLTHEQQSAYNALANALPSAGGGGG